MKKSKLLGTDPIGKVLFQYSVPAIVAMIVSAIYNIVDRIFISQFAGENALAGLTVTFPMMMIIVAFASLVGSGCSALMAIKVGEDDAKGASQIFGTAIALGLLIVLFVSAIFIPNMTAILSVLGADSILMPYAVGYMSIIVIGFAFQVTSFILSGTVRIEGYPFLSMVSMLVGALTNIVLDFVFIGLMGMGVKGAALATVIGQLLGCLVLVIFYIKGKSALQLHFKTFMPRLEETKQIFKVGITSFVSTIGTSVAAVFLNRALINYGGNPAITAMGAISSLSTLFLMPMIGIQQGMQPIIGFNHGAKLKSRVNRTLIYSILASTIFGVGVYITLHLTPEFFLSLFLDKTSSTMGLAVEGLKYFLFAFPVLSVSFIGSAYMVTAKTEEIDKIRGFALGIDDYITKPFSPNELIARVKAHLSRYDLLKNTRGHLKQQIIEVRNVSINTDMRQVYVNEREIDLTAKEYDLLLLLISTPNKVFTKDEIFEKVWGFNSERDIPTITVHIRKLKEKIEFDPSNPEYIQTVWG